MQIILWAYAVILVAFAAMMVTAIIAVFAHAAPNGGTIWFTVPAKVTEIRVRSYKANKIVLDRTLDVVPGQTFRIDPQ